MFLVNHFAGVGWVGGWVVSDAICGGKMDMLCSLHFIHPPIIQKLHLFAISSSAVTSLGMMSIPWSNSHEKKLLNQLRIDIFKVTVQ